MYLSLWQNVFVCIAQCICSYMGPTCSNIHPMLHMAHCSCCSCLVCLWLTALLARGGSQKAGSQAGCLHMENSPAGNSSSPSSTLCWLCLSVSISTSCIVHQPVALFDMPNSNRFDILSISIFSEISFSISISIFSKMSLSISIYSRTALSISIFSRIALSISISIFLEWPYRYRYFQNLPIYRLSI